MCILRFDIYITSLGNQYPLFYRSFNIDKKNLEPWRFLKCSFKKLIRNSSITWIVTHLFFQWSKELLLITLFLIELNWNDGKKENLSENDCCFCPRRRFVSDVDRSPSIGTTNRDGPWQSGSVSMGGNSSNICRPVLTSPLNHLSVCTERLRLASPSSD